MKARLGLAIVAIAIGAWAGASPASAQQSINDCEKIEAWDAYNKCLASFGRKRGGPVRVDPDGGPPEGGRVARRSARSASSGFVRRGRNGRAYAIFDVGSPAKQVRPRRGRR